MDPTQPFTPQDHDSRVSKINFSIKLAIVLLIPLVLIKIFLLFSTKPQQSLPSSPQKNISVSITPYLTQELTMKLAQSAPPLTQATLDDWSKKLASGSETEIQSVVELPGNQLPFPGIFQQLASLAPFQFKLDTFKKNTDNQSGSIAVNLGPQNQRQIILVYLRVINGKWKIVNIDQSPL